MEDHSRRCWMDASRGAGRLLSPRFLDAAHDPARLLRHHLHAHLQAERHGATLTEPSLQPADTPLLPAARPRRALHLRPPSAHSPAPPPSQTGRPGTGTALIGSAQAYWSTIGS